MKRVGTLLLVTITIFLIFSYWRGKTLFSQPIESQTEKKDFNNDYGIPIWIALNSVSEGDFSQARIIYILVQPDEFTEVKLKNAFLGLARMYNEPHFLTIKAFSDESILENAIKYRLSESQKNERAGYFRASYVRIREEEEMNYSPTPDAEELVTIVLKKKSIVYSGNTDIDLMLAANEGDISKVKALLASGADPNITDDTGDTPLMNSILARNKELIALLLPKTNVNKTNNDGFNALMYAAADGDAEIIKELISKGSKVDAQNQRGYSALMLAVARENKEIVKELLEQGVNVNLKNADGRTALSIGHYTNNKEIIRLLKNAGARE
ncbi:MAG: ankyrin repeat domain-containing protein [Acidobacteria bacterium]|nr:ankyrin repeat domain-containing protein [Acidobacteriota bacterium]